VAGIGPSGVGRIARWALNDIVWGVLAVGGTLSGVILGRILEECSKSRAERKARKCFLSALRAEARATMDGLGELLEISEGSGRANILEFLRLAGHQASAGSVFLGLLRNLGLISPSLVQELAAAYVKVRLAAQRGAALAAKPAPDTTGGEVDGVRQEVRRALAVLEEVEAGLGRMLN
jgi:hypothetical protein